MIRETLILGVGFGRILGARDIRNAVFPRLGSIFPDRMLSDFLHGSVVGVTYSCPYQEPLCSGFIAFPDDVVPGPPPFCGTVKTFWGIHSHTNIRLISDRCICPNPSSCLRLSNARWEQSHTVALFLLSDPT